MHPMNFKVSINFLLFVLSGLIVCTCADIQTHDIYPNTTCQNLYNECLALSDVVNERNKYFVSDSILVFHQGEHILQGEDVSISNTSNFTLQAYKGNGSGLSSPAITCINSSLFFSDMSITITSIDFNYCSIRLSHVAAVIQDSGLFNSSGMDGGALSVLHSSMQFDGTNSFAGNMAKRYGGAIFADQSTVEFSGSTAFTENAAQHGGAVYCRNDTSLTFGGSSIFMKNTAEWLGGETLSFLNGGAIYTWYNNTLTFSGSSRFTSNTAEYGGAVFARYSSTIKFSGNSSFMNNRAEHGHGGAVMAWDGNTLGFNVNSSFMSNTADYGGAVFAWDCNSVYFKGNSSFIGNTAEYGGAVCVESNNSLSFDSSMSSTAHNNGGSVLAGNINTLNFIGSSSFMNNTAECYGGAVFARHSNTLNFSGNSSFMNNKAEYGHGGAVMAWAGNTLSFNVNSSFISNTADYGGAVFAWDCNSMYFKGNSSFISNTAEYGGAVCVESNNSLSFDSFMSNTAHNSSSLVLAGNINTLSFNGSSRFMSNTGGAVFARYSNTLNFSGNSSFMSNRAEYGGAVMARSGNSLNFNGNSSFTSNTALENGGAMYAENGNCLSFNGNSSFVNNTAEYGGAACAEGKNTLWFNGNCNFMSNTAEWDGGAVIAWYSNTLSFNGSSSLMNNTAEYGGAVVAMYGNILSFNGNTNFMSNTVLVNGGAMYAESRNNLSLNGNSTFMSNAALNAYGGAVYAEDRNTLSFIGNSSFVSNTAERNGGAVCIWRSNAMSSNGSNVFKNNMAGGDGGAVYAEGNTLSFHGSSIFVMNEATRGGGIAIFSNSLLHLSGTTSLLLNTAGFGGGAFMQDSCIDSTENISVIRNKAIHGGGLFVHSSDITLQGSGLFAGNTATNPEGGYGGAILSRVAKVDFQGSFEVINNTAEFGGGLAFFGVNDGVLIIKDGTNLIFEGNLAHRRGGAIYVDDDSFTFCSFDTNTQNQVEPCFFQTTDGPYDCFNNHDSHYRYQAKSITLKLVGNIAHVSGDIMYGGHVESCVVCSTYSPNYYTWGAEIYYHFAESNIDGLSELSSDPYRVCICEDSHPNCDLREFNRTVYPGQVLVMSVVAVGQMNGTVPSVIRTVFDDRIGTPDFQPAVNSKQCSQLQYPLFSSMPSTSLKLYSDEPCSTAGYPLTFLISFLPCPVGFTLSEQGACICDERLKKYTRNCNIENLTVSRDASDSFWVGVEGLNKLVLHPHCPFDYCIEEPASFPLHSTDTQCAYGRSGILCGACQAGLGLALGSSRCMSDCSLGFLGLLIVFAFAGVALVVFLFLCHLTVAEGTLSGLIFYANVLAVNQTVFFSSGERNLLTVYIAWLNLDLGIETCFFISLDAYYRTLLQFVFPIYIWVIVSVIIVLADRSVCFGKVVGSTNPVAVLATLFLLSYTKLLRAIMAAFSFTSLDYPDGDSRYVWLYDGNIGYLDRHDGRHIALFLFGLLFLLFVFLPYTLLLLCGQWIQKHLWWLPSTWQLYLKFFLDAHYGPYKNQHRYWTGLLLLLRFIMLFVVTIINVNNPQDPYSNLLVILVVSSSLILWGWFVRGFYKKLYHDILEGSFIFNLVVLAGATLQVRQSGGNQGALVYTSMSIAFVTFIGIVLSAVLKRVKEKVAEYQRRAIHQPTNTVSDGEEDSAQLVPTAASTSAVTHSVLEIVRHYPDQTSGEIELRPATAETQDLYS